MALLAETIPPRTRDRGDSRGHGMRRSRCLLRDEELSSVRHPPCALPLMLTGQEDLFFLETSHAVSLCEHPVMVDEKLGNSGFTSLGGNGDSDEVQPQSNDINVYGSGRRNPSGRMQHDASGMAPRAQLGLPPSVSVGLNQGLGCSQLRGTTQLTDTQRHETQQLHNSPPPPPRQPVRPMSIIPGCPPRPSPRSTSP